MSNVNTLPSESSPAVFQLLATIFKLCRKLPSEEQALAHVQRFEEVPLLEAKVKLCEQSMSNLERKLRDEKGTHEAALDRIVSVHTAQSKQQEAKLGDKDRAIENLQQQISGRDAELKKLTVRSDKERSTTRTLETSLETCRQQLEQTQSKVGARESEIATLQGKVEKQTCQAAEIKKEATKAFTDYNDLSKEHEVNLRKLLALEKRTAKLMDWSGAADVFDAWDEAWTRTIRLAYSTAFEDVDDEDGHFLENLRRTAGWNNISLPLCGGGPFPKAMHMAMVVAAVSRILDQQILQPNYSLPGRSGVRDFLFLLAQSDGEREKLIRSCLISSNPEEQQRKVESRILLATRNVMDAVYEILSPTRAEDFRRALGPLIQDFYSIWSQIMHLETAVEPHFHWTAPEVDNGYWRRVCVTKNSVEVAEMRVNDYEKGSDELAVMIPSLCAWKDGRREIISRGTIFIKSDLSEAKKQLSQQSSLSMLLSAGFRSHTERGAAESLVNKNSTNAKETEHLTSREVKEGSIKGKLSRKPTNEGCKDEKTSRRRKDSKITDSDSAPQRST